MISLPWKHTFSVVISSFAHCFTLVFAWVFHRFCPWLGNSRVLFKLHYLDVDFHRCYPSIDLHILSIIMEINVSVGLYVWFCHTSPRITSAPCCYEDDYKSCACTSHSWRMRVWERWESIWQVLVVIAVCWQGEFQLWSFVILLMLASYCGWNFC